MSHLFRPVSIVFGVLHSIIKSMVRRWPIHNFGDCLRAHLVDGPCCQQQVVALVHVHDLVLQHDIMHLHLRWRARWESLVRVHLVLVQDQRRFQLPTCRRKRAGRALLDVVGFSREQQLISQVVLLLQTTGGIVLNRAGCRGTRCLALHFVALPAAHLHVALRVGSSLVSHLRPVQVCHLFLELSICLHLFNHFLAVAVQFGLLLLDAVDVLVHLD